jgi:hypothetical protein
MACGGVGCRLGLGGRGCGTSDWGDWERRRPGAVGHVGWCGRDGEGYGVSTRGRRGQREVWSVGTSRTGQIRRGGGVGQVRYVVLGGTGKAMAGEVEQAGIRSGWVVGSGWVGGTGEVRRIGDEVGTGWLVEAESLGPGRHGLSWRTGAGMGGDGLSSGAGGAGTVSQ